MQSSQFSRVAPSVAEPASPHRQEASRPTPLPAMLGRPLLPASLSGCQPRAPRRVPALGCFLPPAHIQTQAACGPPPHTASVPPQWQGLGMNAVTGIPGTCSSDVAANVRSRDHLTSVDSGLCFLEEEEDFPGIYKWPCAGFGERAHRYSAKYSVTL